MQPKAEALRALIAAPGLLVMPGCGDGMGARLIAEAGFKAGFVSGSTVAALRLAGPDMDLLAFPEMADAIDTVTNAAPEVLWLADGDTGYGNEINVARTIAACAKAGAAAVLIEDKAYPRPLGHKGGKVVVDRVSARRRCRAAVEACRQAGILLLARTDAIHAHGRDEALARIADFAAEGADLLYLDSPQSVDDLRAAIAAANGRPAVAVTSPGAKHVLPSDAELERLGIKLNIRPTDMLAAGIEAMRSALAPWAPRPRPVTRGAAGIDSAIRRDDYLEQDARWAPNRDEG